MKVGALRIVALMAVLLAAAWMGSTVTTGSTTEWPPLLTCPDTNGDGQVDLPNDILGVMNRYQTYYGGPPNPNSGMDYVLIYDVSGGNYIDLVNDILGVIRRYQEQCPLVDSQVAQVTQAVMQYRDPNEAIGDGYVPVTQNVQGHGVHWLNGSLMDGVLELTRPEGLNYSLDGELLNVYYIDPLWLPGHEQPVEWLFDGDEDMWHDHPGLCVWTGPNGEPLVNENVAQADCPARPNGIWFQSFGWMMHLWNFLPNAMGRFEMHNDKAG